MKGCENVYDIAEIRDSKIEQSGFRAIARFFGQKVLSYFSFTPPNSEIICGQNVGTKVVCGMILFFEKKTMLKI